MKFKKLENLKYKFLYGDSTLYQRYEIFDILIIYLNDIGIKSLKNDEEYYSTIIFNDNTEFIFWRKNEHSAWMSYGTINFSNGEKLKWSSKSPSYKVLYLFKKALEEYQYTNDNFNIKNYSKYLPLKYIRKEKLKRLK